MRDQASRQKFLNIVTFDRFWNMYLYIRPGLIYDPFSEFQQNEAQSNYSLFQFCIANRDGIKKFKKQIMQEYKFFFSK